MWIFQSEEKISEFIFYLFLVETILFWFQLGPWHVYTNTILLLRQTASTDTISHRQYVVIGKTLIGLSRSYTKHNMKIMLPVKETCLLFNTFSDASVINVN